MDNKNENKKNKKPGRTGLIVFLIAFVLPQLIAAVDEFDLDYLLWRLRHGAFRLGIDPELLPVIGAGIVVLIVLLIAAGKRSPSAMTAQGVPPPPRSAPIPETAASPSRSRAASSATTRERITSCATSSSASPSSTSG